MPFKSREESIPSGSIPQRVASAGDRSRSLRVRARRRGPRGL